MDAISHKQKMFFFIYVTYLWIPLRRRLDIDYKLKKFHTNNAITIGKEVSPTDNTDPISFWLPRIQKWGILYYIVSTTAQIINFTINSILLYSGGRKPNNKLLAFLVCHSHRIIVHEILNQPLMGLVGLIVSLFHVFWRYSMLIYERELKLDAIIFLLMDEKHIKDESNAHRATKSYHSGLPLNLTQSIMFYKIESKRQNYLKFHLKPNRTLEARAKLTQIVNMGFNLTILPVVVLVILGVPSAGYTFATKLQNFYEGCDVSGFNLANFNRFIGGATLPFFVLSEVALVMVANCTIGSFLVADQAIYWHHIEDELNKLEKIMLLRTLKYELINKQRFEYNQNSCFSKTKYLEQQSNMRKGERGTHYLDYEMEQYLSWKIYELQSAMIDYFNQLEQVDQYITQDLGQAFGSWLLWHLLITFSGLRNEVSFDAYYLSGLQTFTLVIVIFVGYRVLKLKRRAEVGYRLICSLMANDLSLEKKRWIILLRYYTGKPKYSFTIMHAKIFSTGLMIKIFSYTFTIVIFLQEVLSMRRRR